jgi:hypothetical protein
LIGGGAALMVLTVVRGNLDGLVFPFLLCALGILRFSRTGQALRHFPSTDLERGLNRLFALLLPAQNTTTTASLRLAIAQQARLTRLRRGTRRWGKELQLIAADGYETTSRISALHRPEGERNNRRLVAKTVKALKVERARAGVDQRFANDPVTMLAYGIGTRPARTDLGSLEDLLFNLGLAEGDELRTHFDDVLAERAGPNPRLRTAAERTMFRELAGAAFVLGASTRILELAAPSSARDTQIRLATAS